MCMLTAWGAWGVDETDGYATVVWCMEGIDLVLFPDGRAYLQVGGPELWPVEVAQA